MMLVLRKARMSELCEITSSKRIFAADYVSEGVPFYRGKEITEKYKGSLDVSTELFITEEKFNEIERKFGAPRKGDLLLTSVGTLGSPYVVKPGERFYFKDGNLTWFRYFRELDSKFLYYWLVSPQGKAELQKCTIGSSQSAFTIVLLKGMEIELPSLSIQQRIASILSAYDELIENNQRRIRILEEMARSLYREWFVHFRYPGHDSPRPQAGEGLGVRAGFVDSPLGQIPQGWEVKKIAELLAKVSRQGKIKTQDYLQTGDLPVIDQGRELVGGYTNDADVEYSGELPVIVFGDHTRILKFIDFPFACGADGTQLLRSNDERMPVSLFYYTLSVIELSDFAYARHFKFLKEELVVVPIAEVATAFSERVDPIKRQVRILQQQSDNLRRTRDLLLPRLLSGGINIQVTNQEQCHV